MGSATVIRELRKTSSSHCCNRKEADQLIRKSQISMASLLRRRMTTSQSSPNRFAFLFTFYYDAPANMTPQNTIETKRRKMERNGMETVFIIVTTNDLICIIYGFEAKIQNLLTV